jgi:hypothetical protein
MSHAYMLRENVVWQLITEELKQNGEISLTVFFSMHSIRLHFAENLKNMRNLIGKNVNGGYRCITHMCFRICILCKAKGLK